MATDCYTVIVPVFRIGYKKIMENLNEDEI